MILNWNKSLWEKNDKILCALSLKNIPRMKDGVEEENEEGGKERERVIDAFFLFYPECPAAGLESLFCFLCLSLGLFPPFFLLSFILLPSPLVFFTPPCVLRSFYFQAAPFTFLTLPQSNGLTAFFCLCQTG